MEITSITKFKHGKLWEALKKLEWTQSDLARATGYSASRIGDIINLKRRPTEEQAECITLALTAAGATIDIEDCWPPEFTGSGGKRVVVEATHNVDPHTLLPHQPQAQIEMVRSTKDLLKEFLTHQQVLISQHRGDIRTIHAQMLYDHLVRGYTLDQIATIYDQCHQGISVHIQYALKKFKQYYINELEAIQEDSEQEDRIYRMSSDDYFDHIDMDKLNEEGTTNDTQGT